MTAQQVQVVQRLFAAAAAGDAGAIGDLLHPDFVINQVAGTPYGGTYHGFDGFMTMYGVLTSHFDIAQRDLRFHDVGDGEIGVIVTFDVDFTSLRTGRQATSGNAELYRFADGQIIRIDVYYQNAVAVADLAAAGVESAV